MMRCSCMPSSGCARDRRWADPTTKHPPTMDRGCFVQMLRVVVMAVTVLVLIGGLVDNGRLGGAGYRPFQLGTFERVTAGSRPKMSVGADLPFSAWDPRSVSPGGRQTKASTVC